MEVIKLIILIFIIITIFLSIKKNGINSFITLGLIGNAIYSIPAILGIHLAFYESPSILVKNAILSEEITLLIWFILFVLVFLTKPLTLLKYQSFQIDFVALRYLNKSVFIFSIIGILAIILLEGTNFIFSPRNEISVIRYLWRWAIVTGLFTSIILRQYNYTIFYAILLIIYFLSGDRTILALFFFGFLVILYTFYRVSYKHYILVILLSLVLIFGKIIYGSFKTLDISILTNYEYWLTAIKGFEPLVTFGIFNYVIEYDIYLTYKDLYQAIIGQFLIIPSIFGITTNIFNLKVTNSLSIYLTYGIAGSYWGYAWSLGKLPGIIIFTILYFYLLYFWSYLFYTKKGIIKILSLVIGSLTASYIYRNGFDNFLSFYRQIFLFFMIVIFINFFLRKIKELTLLKSKKYL